MAALTLVLVLLIGSSIPTQAQPSTAPTLKTPDNEDITNDNTPYFSWENIIGENILNFHLVIDNDSNFADGENFYYNSNLIDNFDNFDTHSENALSDGIWYWKVRAENANGPGPWSGGRWLKVDVTSPTVQISVNTSMVFDNYVGADNFVVTATFSENMDNTITPTITFTPDVTSDTLENVVFAWTVDNSVATWTYDVDDEGAENLGVDVTISGGKDLAGNDQVDNTGENMFSVDTLAPVAPTLVSPDDGARTADSTPTLSWNTVSDNSPPVTYDLQVDDDSNFSSPTQSVSGLTSNSYTTSSLADGTWYWHVRARDNAGNIGSWSSGRSFTVDTAAQAAPALTAPANGAITNNSTPTFDWESVSGAASYTLEYSIDNGTPTTISSAATDYIPTAGLADGTWNWRVRTVDAVGNTGSWSSTWFFTIDTATPTVTISPSLGATPTATGWTLNTTNTSIEISGSVTDATGVTVKIDDVKVNVVDRSFRKTVNLMVIGVNTFTIAVTDAAGNTTTRTLKVIRGGVAPPPAAEPAISSEQALFIAALAVLAIVVMVFVKTVLVKKPAEPSQVPAPPLEFERGVRGLFHLQKPI
ncbi:hypothetical protein ES703_20073 [subsurface metagenome]